MPQLAVTWPEHLLSPRVTPQHLRAGGQGGRPLPSQGMPIHSDFNGGEVRGLAHGRGPGWHVATSE